MVDNSYGRNGSSPDVNSTSVALTIAHTRYLLDAPERLWRKTSKEDAFTAASHFYASSGAG